MMPQTHCFEPEANRPVVGRFAPSPTGRMHAGNIYAALTAWLVAKSQGGTIVLRIEDLDQVDRSKAEYISAVQRDFELLGLTWDHGPFFQHDRDEAYSEAFQALGRQGLVYPCFCTRADLHAASAPAQGREVRLSRHLSRLVFGTGCCQKPAKGSCSAFTRTRCHVLLRRHGAGTLRAKLS